MIVHAVMLRLNYRSHASLLALPNRLFYANQLEAAADQHAVRPLPWSPDNEDLILSDTGASLSHKWFIQICINGVSSAGVAGGFPTFAVPRMSANRSAC